jgi:FlaG/FlaF family flagellin (archaellin)
MDKFRKVLPWLALAALLAAVSMMIFIPQQRSTFMVENPENRQAVIHTLEETVSSVPMQLDDPDFSAAVQSLAGQNSINYVWIFDLDGDILLGTARYASSGNVHDLATENDVRVLDSLPEDSLTTEQETAILAVSTMRLEGEHNDVFRHTLVEVHAPDGSLLGWIGAAYDANPTIGGTTTSYIIELLVFLVCMGIYWLALPIWTWLDARRRGEKAVIWAIFVLLGNLVALTAYLLVRSKPINS